MKKTDDEKAIDRLKTLGEAAPDMLAALKGLVKMIEDHRRCYLYEKQSYIVDHNEHWEAAKVAIAKAEGKTGLESKLLDALKLFLDISYNTDDDNYEEVSKAIENAQEVRDKAEGVES